MSLSPHQRRRAALIVDRVVGIAIALPTAVIALALLTQLSQFSGLGTGDGVCAGVAADGLRCSPAFLTTMVIVGTALIIFGWAITTGLMVVRFIQKRLGWFLPLIGFAALIVGFYAPLLILYASYLPAS